LLRILHQRYPSRTFRMEESEARHGGWRWDPAPRHRQARCGGWWATPGPRFARLPLCQHRKPGRRSCETNETDGSGHAVRVVGEAEPRPVPAPIVAQAHEGFLVGGDAADLAAAPPAGELRWVRVGGASARLLSGHRRSTLLWSRPFGCLLGGSPVGPFLYPVSALYRICISNASFSCRFCISFRLLLAQLNERESEARSAYN
jgi:hypothetical protein